MSVRQKVTFDLVLNLSYGSLYKKTTSKERTGEGGGKGLDWGSAPMLPLGGAAG
ncbi:hypothetical protein HOLleu_28541 [Holothuria leucospilota]|uniref:Uncharacterized protein n=1 Tax=Holothuria leucospilota TaxID=206669 RepID=A0A9Q1H0Z1_HOLLE|nr:hypothetical protein HOLleu_28541 [Holothuria leucospilota]